MSFLGESYLLSSKTGIRLFDSVRELPVVDAHNHANVAEIAANENYSDPWRLFAATDHYVWEVLRKRSVPEKFITGDATPEEKWMRMAEVFPQLAGNPVYEWMHLDLRRYLGIDALIGPDTGEEIWEEASRALAEDSSRPLAFLKKIGVEVMCSTDDPKDLLEEHDVVNSAAGKTLVRPTWRPDKAMNINAASWRDYLSELGARFNSSLDSLTELLDVLRFSHDYFDQRGCRASDHGLLKPYSGTASFEDADRVFKMVFDGAFPTAADAEVFKSFILGEMAEMDAEKGWVFQLHMGAVRDVRGILFESLGPDVGGDVSDHNIDILTPLVPFLNRFDDRLKVVLYCLEPGHQATLATIARAFGAKVNLGSAWWLCDNPIGMRRQLEYIGGVDLFANFAGMVSDSRKLFSYGSRFEMFRRVLSDVVGAMVERGQVPFEVAETLVERMCYSGPKEFFRL
ncbi:MAG: glucuronate isomerase [Kiritimatiellaeota bacterium]|nr:glucuronate isomerase [Kiritimatiellota bacterium]